jgi:N-acetylmuramoyl-L-alanine amidase
LRWRLIACSFIIVVGCLGAWADTLVVAGRSQRLSAPLIVDGDDVLAPLTPALRLLGARAAVRGTTATITASDDRTITVTAGSAVAQATGGKVNLAAAPRDVGGTLYLPARALAPWLNAEARYDEAARTLTLNPLVTVATSRGDDGRLQVQVHSAAPLQYRSGTVNDPPRVYYDFQQAALGMAEQQVPAEDPLIARMRLSQYGTAPAVVRLVIDLHAPGVLTATMSEQGRLLTISAAPAPPPMPLPALPAVRLTGVTLTQSAAQQSELAVALDGATDCTPTYNARTRQLTLSFPTGVNALPTDGLAGIADALVAGITAAPGANDTGVRLVVTLKKDAGYLLQREPTGVRVLLGLFDIRNMLIVVDAGHGGHDTGARGQRTLEKDVNLDVAQRAAALLSDAGARVLLTRNDDTFIPLDDRPALANTEGADLFISIHSNSTAVRNSCSGTQTYYTTPQSSGLAAAMQTELVSALGLKNGGVRTANFLVTRKSRMPAILIEIAFINNTTEEKLLADPAFRQRTAAAIVNGVRRYAATRTWQLQRVERPAPAPAPAPTPAPELPLPQAPAGM